MKAIFTLDCGYSFPVELKLYGGGGRSPPRGTGETDSKEIQPFTA